MIRKNPKLCEFFLLIALSFTINSVLQAQVISRTVITSELEMMRIDGIGGANTNVFQTVKYRNQYDSAPVVACNLVLSRVVQSSSDQFTGTEDWGVIRLDNVSKNGFEIKVMPYNNTSTIGATTAACVVAKQGAHSIPNKSGDDLNFYAGTVVIVYKNIANSSGGGNPNRANNRQDIASKAVADHLSSNFPTLLSQLMTNKNPDTFLTAWNHRCGKVSTSTPRERYGRASKLGDACVSLHVGDYQIPKDYLEETVGFIAIDTGKGVTPKNIRYESFVSSKAGAGVGEIDSPDDFSLTLNNSYRHVVGDQNGQIGGHMSWMVQHNIDNALANKKFRYAFEDLDRNHRSEQFSGFAASQSKVDLRLNKAVSSPTPAIGSTVTFTLEVMNDGPDTARDVLVNDRLPTGFAYVDKSMTGGNQMSVDADQLTWEIEQLATNESIMLSFDATVARPTP